jgi:hypothetical protein
MAFAALPFGWPISLGSKVPKFAALTDEAEPDVLAYMSFPPQHYTTPRARVALPGRGLL